MTHSDGLPRVSAPTIWSLSDLWRCCRHCRSVRFLPSRVFPVTVYSRFGKSRADERQLAGSLLGEVSDGGSANGYRCHLVEVDAFERPLGIGVGTAGTGGDERLTGNGHLVGTVALSVGSDERYAVGAVGETVGHEILQQLSVVGVLYLDVVNGLSAN